MRTNNITNTSASCTVVSADVAILNSAMPQPEGVTHSDLAAKAANDEFHYQRISVRVRRA